jgi:hypothetical protein
MAFFAASDLVPQLFALLGIWAARLRVPWPESYTPIERGDALGHTVPDAAPAVRHLTQLFAAQRYGRLSPAERELAVASENWRYLQPVFWKRWAALIAERVFGRRR